jgi:hypothetical protein
MGFLGWLFGNQVRNDPVIELDAGDEEFDIVGELQYQNALAKLAGGYSSDGANELCEAHLVPENDNPHDKNAVRVDIQERTVGYLSREHAKAYRKRLGESIGRCQAEIVGGWDRGKGDKGFFGVKLDIRWPPRPSKN